jgi:EAL domain-containing protein (putative c-di-GMP-specific phosphodiesterase class I)
LIENIDETIETLNTLKSLGISISIDDFGTGYSSLSYLKRFPIDQLKIDKSFVQDLSMNSSDDAIVTAIIAIAQKLDMKIIAEGVETISQSEFLQENKCSLAQGYLYYKPMSLAQLKCL